MSEWRTVVGYPDYEVSDQGEIRRPFGARRGGVSHTMTQKFRGKYLCVWLLVDGKRKAVRVHKIVTETFLGPCPEDLQVRHLNDDKTDNRLANLVYGTSSENNYDAVLNGVHHNAAKTVCKWGHDLTEDNVRIMVNGGRRCRKCQQEWDRAPYSRRQKTEE